MFAGKEQHSLMAMATNELLFFWISQRTRCAMLSHILIGHVLFHVVLTQALEF